MVVVEVSVADDGSVTDAALLSSCGHSELDAAALEAVRTASFAPATEDGAAVSGRLRMTFEFRLD
jgi:protein TonB